MPDYLHLSFCEKITVETHCFSVTQEKYVFELFIHMIFPDYRVQSEETKIEYFVFVC
jgi:hypothetical protein